MLEKEFVARRMAYGRSNRISSFCVTQTLPDGFDMEFKPFWMLTEEEEKRHFEYEHKSNNWLKMHGRPMRRQCMGVKCRRRKVSAVILDEAWLLAGSAAGADFAGRVVASKRTYGGPPLESYKGVYLGLPAGTPRGYTPRPGSGQA